MRGTTAFRTFAALAVLLTAWSVSRPAGAFDIREVTSPKGVKAWLVQETSVPAISVSFAFRAGSASDPAGKAGLADMVSATLDEGAGELDSQAFQRALEETAVSLRFTAGYDRFSGSMRTLSVNRAEAFRLLRLAIAAPRFDREPVERIRAQLQTGLSRDAEDPDWIARRTYARTVFPDHPYGRHRGGTAETIAAITRDDLRGFVRRHLARDNLVIGVVGDIGPEELARRLDEVFGALPEKAAALAVAETAPGAAGKTVVIRRRIPQSVVVFGHAGIKRDDPDWYIAYVMMRIFGGGGFSSRLTEEVREKRGLAYGVYAYLDPYDHAALISGSVATANARVGRSLEVIRAEWRRLAENGVTEAELAAAKTYINGSFPLRMDSNRRIANILVGVQSNGLDIGYLDRRPTLIDAVTIDDVRRVARRLMKPDALTVVVVGDPKDIDATP